MILLKNKKPRTGNVALRTLFTTVRLVNYNCTVERRLENGIIYNEIYYVTMK